MENVLMPRPKSLIPPYRRHSSGQARVTINGRDHLLVQSRSSDDDRSEPVQVRDQRSHEANRADVQVVCLRRKADAHRL